MSDVTTIAADVPAPYADAVERFGVATAWGCGPRFLHSTGQLHKGGPPGGAFHGLDAARVHVEQTDQIKELL
jgi:hypothetical protein